MHVHVVYVFGFVFFASFIIRLRKVKIHMTLTFLPSSIVCYAFESCLHSTQSSELFKDNTNYCTKRVSHSRSHFWSREGIASSRSEKRTNDSESSVFSC